MSLSPVLASHHDVVNWQVNRLEPFESARLSSGACIAHGRESSRTDFQNNTLDVAQVNEVMEMRVVTRFCGSPGRAQVALQLKKGDRFHRFWLTRR